MIKKNAYCAKDMWIYFNAINYPGGASKVSKINIGKPYAYFMENS